MVRKLILLLLLVPAIALAAGPSVKLDSAPVNVADAQSLQAGARTFVNYCLNCHSASLVRYNQLKQIGLSEQAIRENLLFTAEKVGGLMTIAASPKDQKEWFGAMPPDLSVVARSRGADWLYTYFRGYYRDPASATGWNNTVYPNVGMPNVLWQLQGVREAEKIVTKDSHGHERTELKLSAAKGGLQSAQEFDRTIADLTNFLVWMGEPHQLERKRVGYYVLMALAVLMLLTYLLKVAFWKNVH